MPRGDPRTPERRRLALQWHSDGLSYRAIAHRLGIHVSSVARLVTPRKVTAAPRPRRPRRLDPRTLERRAAARRMRQSGLTLRAIGEALGGISDVAVHYLLNRIPYSPEDSIAPPIDGREERLAELVSLPWPPGVRFADDALSLAAEAGSPPSRPLDHSPCSASAGWE